MEGRFCQQSPLQLEREGIRKKKDPFISEAGHIGFPAFHRVSIVY